MCGIYGYKGNYNAAKILLNGLKKLEYRGYDSAGIAIGSTKTKEIKIFKSVGEVSNLFDAVGNLNNFEEFDYGIAHTRWATHGKVIINNTHPHYDKDEKFFVVHNGIIENYKQLKDFLISKGYKFYGDTDTEVIANLLNYYDNGDFLSTVEIVIDKLEGAYALLIINKNNIGEIIGVKYGSPLVFGINNEKLNNKEFYFSSDVNGLADVCENVMFLDDGDIVYINEKNEYIIKSQGKLISKSFEKIDVDNLKIDKCGYEHFMLKEIFEQPEVINRVLSGRIDWSSYDIVSDSLKKLDDYNIKKIIFIACGTSYNAGWLGSYFIEDIANLESNFEIASEFIYKNFKVDSNTLFVFISQSGETADTIEALKLVKQKGGLTFGIVNVVGSTISRLTDFGMFTRAGVEVGVASTKAFISQILVILLLSLYLGRKNNLNYIEYKNIISGLKHLSNNISLVLKQANRIEKISYNFKKYSNFFFLGRHLMLPIAFESSLKFKEITYLHSEAYPAGELKHGPLALIDENIPSILFIPRDGLEKENLSSLEEIKSRNGKILLISDDENLKDKGDWFIEIPSISNKYFYPFLTVVVGQLLAYYVAKSLGKEIDKPRNLAKSVTVK